MIRRISEPGMGLYPPRIALPLRAPANQRSTRGIGVSTSCGAVSTRKNSIFVCGVSSCRDMEGFMNRGWSPILPGLSLLYAPQPIIDRPVGLGCSLHVGRWRPGKTRFSSPGCQSCRYMEGCLNRRWGPILAGCSRTLPPSAPRRLVGDTEGLMIRAWGPILSGWRWLYELQPISDRTCDWVFHIVRASADPGDFRFHPWGFGVVVTRRKL